MSETNNDLRTDIRETVYECLVLMECVQVALEMAKRKAEDRSALIDLGALGKFIDQVDEQLKDLDDLISSLLDKEIQLDPGTAATALAFYGDPANYRSTRSQSSEIAKDAGRIAREALAAIGGESGEADGE
jgi:hypothetical protein